MAKVGNLASDLPSRRNSLLQQGPRGLLDRARRRAGIRHGDLSLPVPRRGNLHGDHLRPLRDARHQAPEAEGQVAEFPVMATCICDRYKYISTERCSIS